MFSEKRFHTGTIEINYAEGPHTGPPLVLLHGLTFRWQSFLPLLPGLVEKWHVFAPDFRGHGRSDRSRGLYLFNDLVEDTARFLEERVGSPTVNFGHSLGGAVGLHLAAKRKDLVGALIMADNFFYWDSYEELMRDPAIQTLFSGLRELARRQMSVEETQAALADLRLPVAGAGEVRFGDLPGNDSVFLRAWAESLMQLDPNAVGVVFENLRPEDSDGSGLLQEVSCPLLLLQADPASGGVMPDRDVERALSAQPGATYHRFDHLGHMMHMHNPAGVLAVVDKFLMDM